MLIDLFYIRNRIACEIPIINGGLWFAKAVLEIRLLMKSRL